MRHIDWNVTARMDTPFVRQYAEDRELTAWLLLDWSRSMGFGPIDRPGRSSCASSRRRSRLLTRGGNRVGAILFDNEPRGDAAAALEPQPGARTRAEPPPAASRYDGAVTDLTRLLETAHRTIRRRSLVVLVSDFITAPGWERPLLRSANGMKWSRSGSSTLASTSSPTQG